MDSCNRPLKYPSRSTMYKRKWINGILHFASNHVECRPSFGYAIRSVRQVDLDCGQLWMKARKRQPITTTLVTFRRDSFVFYRVTLIREHETSKFVAGSRADR